MSGYAPDRDVWRGILDRAASGLDLADEEDRATFRVRLGEVTRDVRVEFLRSVLRLLGEQGSPGRSRSEVVRALAHLRITGRA